MPSLRDQADPLLAILREVVGPAPSRSDPANTLESILNAWLDDDGRATRALRDEGLLDIQELATISPDDLAERLPRVLRRSDTATVQRLAAWLLDQADAVDLNLECPAERPTEQLRQALRSIRGLGPAAADRILLHALGRPVFPVSRGAYRIAVRHGWIDPTTELDEARSTLEQIANDDPAGLSIAVEGLERIAARFCKPTVAKCRECPLGPLLGPDGPRQLTD